jgi:hypothetical protein
VWSVRAVIIVPVKLKEPLAGSYSSACATGPPGIPFNPLVPPAIRTWPLDSSDEVWPHRALLRSPVLVKGGSRRIEQFRAALDSNPASQIGKVATR